MDTLLQKEIGELREFYVEMHPMHGHDSHNPPLLYHSDIEKVDELFDDINKALLRFTRSVIEEAMPEEKEQLDKNDPDNYGACYAIGGWNHCRTQIKENAERILKDNEKEV